MLLYLARAVASGIGDATGAERKPGVAVLVVMDATRAQLAQLQQELRARRVLHKTVVMAVTCESAPLASLARSPTHPRARPYTPRPQPT